MSDKIARSRPNPLRPVCHSARLSVLASALALLLPVLTGDAEPQTITTVAGTDPLGDGGPATSAELNNPAGVAVDASGNLFIADEFNHRIRKVAAGAGVITTVAGSGSVGVRTGGFGGDGGPATGARLNEPEGIAVDASGNLFIADTRNHSIRKVDLARPAITSPPPGAVFSRGSPLPATFAWTVVPGAAQYGFEHTGAGLQFANPNGTGPDPVNGFGGAGGGIVVSGTSFSITPDPCTPAGTNQVRVIGLSPSGQAISTFSDAVIVVVL